MTTAGENGSVARETLGNATETTAGADSPAVPIPCSRRSRAAAVDTGGKAIESQCADGGSGARGCHGADCSRGDESIAARIRNGCAGRGGRS